MDHQILLSEIQFLPSTCYFKNLISCEKVAWELHENYQKQSYRNRCDILTSNGIQTLIVPVKKGSSKILTKDVEIEYAHGWDKKIMHSIRTAYASSPYYDYYIDGFVEIMNKKHQYLYTLNMALLQYCFKSLDMEKEITVTKSFTNNVSGHIKDERDSLTNKRKRIEDWDCNDNTSYIQLFGSKFVQNLSIIDLLFNEGPLAKQYL